MSHLAFLPDVEVLRPRRGRYELVVFGNSMLFPSRISGDTAAPDKIRLRTSKVRHEMFSLETRTGLDEPLSFDALDYEEETTGPRYTADFGSATSLIFIAFDCSARGGLQHVYVGEATLQEDGTVVWLYREELPLRALEDATLTLVTDEPAARFDDSPAPTTTLKVRNPGEDAEEDELADPAAEDEATGTGNDERI